MDRLQRFLTQKGLSRAEIEVSEVIAEGVSNAVAADRLFRTEKTIKFHLTNIYRKLEIKNRNLLIIMCAPYGEVKVPEDINTDAEYPSNVPGLPKGSEVDL